MAQSNWTYRSPRGRKYHVGLYHGDESGHVIIYCNNNILAIDFSVMKRKVYSFYIERELCEMVLEPENGHFEYDFRLSGRDNTQNDEAQRYEVLDYVFMGLAGLLFFSIIFSLAIAIS